MSQCRALNWTRDCLDEDRLPLEAYGDISGLGVIIGFVGTGYLVLILMILNYLISYDPTQCPWPGQEAKFRWRANPADVLFLRWIRRIKETDPNPFRGRASLLQRSFEKVSILSLCDIQIATGLSILTSAFILGPQCGLDAYHWQMIVHLAWFSAVTHLSGLFALRGYIAKRRLVKYIRVGLMFCLVIMLLVATVPTVFFNWNTRLDDSSSSPYTAADPESAAVCFLNLNYGVQHFNDRVKSKSDGPSEYPYRRIGYEDLQHTHKFQTTIFSVVMLVFGLTTRSVKLFGPLSRSFSKFLREPVSTISQEYLKKVAQRQSKKHGGLWKDVFITPALAMFMTLRLTVVLAGSMLAEVYWLLCLVLWGTFNLLSSRESIPQDIVLEESQWTFGQILPVLLLGGPFVAISSNIASEWHKYRQLLPNSSSRIWHTITLDTLNMDNSEALDGNSEQSAFHTPHHTSHSEETALELQSMDTNEAQRRISRSPESEGLSFWLDRDSLLRSPWIPICLVMPCILVVCFTIALLSQVFNLAYKWKPDISLFSVWVTQVGLLFTLLVEYPAACTATVILGLRLNNWILNQRQGSHWRAVIFACSLVSSISSHF
ncbi:hypothetical protein PG984_009975 [Apiospora sp. TS-2023a]